MSLDAHIFDLESNDNLVLDDLGGVLLANKSILLLRVLHLSRNLGVGNEDLAGSDLHFEANFLDSSHYSVQNFVFERSVDEGFETDCEDGLTVVVN